MNPFNVSPYTYQIDLTFYEDIKKYNSNYIGLLNIIEITSRKAWAYNIKNKSGDTILNIMKKFINDNEVYSIESDDGKEFNLLQKYCNDNNINYIKINKVYYKNSMTIVE